MTYCRNEDIIRLWVEPATKQRNDELYPAVVAGCNKAREEMIQSNIGLVMQKVAQFILFQPRFAFQRDDLIGQGILGLVAAVNAMAAGEEHDEANATAFMAKVVSRFVGQQAETLADVRIPRRSYRRKKARDSEYEAPAKTQSIVVHTSDKLAEEIYYDDYDVVCLRHVVELCCESETEKRIIELREKGYVDREIASELKMPLTTVYVMRRTIYARFLEVTGWKGTA